jgi:membrane fusion protein, multidrug efflux system
MGYLSRVTARQSVPCNRCGQTRSAFSLTRDGWLGARAFMGEQTDTSNAAGHRPRGSTTDVVPAPQSERHPPLQQRRGGPDAAPPTWKPWFRRALPMGLVMGLLIVAIIGGALWWRHSRTYERTDDAYIDIIAQRVSPQIAGRVVRVLVGDNEDVANGQVLLELDPQELRVRLEQAQAARMQAEAQVAQAEAQRTIRMAELDQARAGAAAATTTAENAASDFSRLQQARAGDEAVASAQQVEHAAGESRSTDAQRRGAEKAVAAAEAQLALVGRQIDAARAASRSAAAQLEQAELMLSYTQVKADVVGRVANKNVTVGNYVEPGSPVMAIVPRAVYVTAQFKETQLARLHTGQPVEVKVDAYPDVQLRGHIDSVQPATGNAFTPLPAQNAAGNWVKVVQRVPVKIALDELPRDPSERLGPGMSAEVKVDVRPRAVAVK